jgi:hypothetical protein
MHYGLCQNVCLYLLTSGVVVSFHFLPARFRFIYDTGALYIFSLNFPCQNAPSIPSLPPVLPFPGCIRRIPFYVGFRPEYIYLERVFSTAELP